VTVAKGLGDLDLDPESDYGRRLLNIILEGLDDESHEVRAALIPLIRTKKIPGAFSVLIHLVDEEMDESERSALRFALPEFTYQAFSANFEKIAEEMRPFIGNMVRQIDADAMAGLEKELNGPSPVRRKRSLFVAESMGLLSEVEEQVLASLNDEDHMVRIAAAQVLAKMSSSPTWAALKDSMLDDKNASVRFAAEASLEAICDKMNSTEEDDTPSETFSAEQVEKAIKRDPNKDFILE